MKSKDGYIQGYKAHATVRAEAQVIVATVSTPRRHEIAITLRDAIFERVQPNLNSTP